MTEVDRRATAHLHSLRLFFLLIALAGVGAVCLVSALGLADSTAPVLAAVFVGVVLSIGFARGEAAIASNLLLLAVGARLIALVLTFSIRAAHGVETVNPDAAEYLRWAKQVAPTFPYAIDIRPWYRAGTYDVGFHYLLGAFIRLVGTDSVTLLTIEAILGALVVLLVLILCPRTELSLRVLPAYCAAIYPSLLYMSGGDFLKDPSVLLATLGAFAVVGISLRSPPFRAAALGIVAGILLFFVQATRYYVTVISLAAFAASALRLGISRRGSLRFRSSLAAAALSIFLGLQGATILSRHPSIVRQMTSYTTLARSNERIWFGVEGRVAARLRRGDSPGLSQLPDLYSLRSASVGEKVRLLHAPQRSGRGPLQLANDLVRKLYGAYLWVLPRGWPFTLIDGSLWDYLSTPIWYVLAPMGLLAAFFGLRERHDFVGLAVSCSALATTLLLLVFNLSFRQRASLVVPFLLLAMGFHIRKIPARYLSVAMVGQGAIILGLAAIYYVLRG